MRKIIVSLILLILVALSVFFIGWTTLVIPPGAYAVVLTKSSGWAEAPIPPGKFSWHWERLLPTNMNLFCFQLNPSSHEFSLSGELPQAGLYASFMPEKPDFSYEFRGSLFLRVKASALPGIVRDYSVRDEAGLKLWISQQAQDIAARLSQIVQLRSGESEYGALFASGGKALADNLIAEIAEDFPRFDILSINIASYRFPDSKLYEQGKSIYTSYLGAKKSFIEPVIRELAQKGALDEYRLESLERYGELLNRYPILIDYLAVERGMTLPARHETATPAQKE